ncbi:probable G-protein coupled receptor 141 [Gracilinanus agilis]|uniref:probable G-protein coupled receptor 141 n=1 Tax=Gracilinanus agilis TaxID=191870 RepID=UPI001CFECDEC|nr:probable G-protein coupled receptor 141 [Gracilinanus agilis]
MAEQNASSQPSPCDLSWSRHLTGLYVMVLVGGLAGIVCILFVLANMNTRSVTTTAVINLVLVHGAFLVTVPFRLVYLARGEWYFGLPFCKVVSATLHVHMYLTFLFYVGILGVRYLVFFKHRDKMEFYRKLHAVAASAALWLLVAVTIIPPLLSRYGSHGTYNATQCFEFQGELKENSVKVVNYVVAAGVIAIAFSLLGLQGVIMASMGKRLRRACLSHQEFWAQLKNLVFLGVIFVCFLPYQFFRLYYLREHAAKDSCQRAATYNELFLSFTAVSCFDLLLFVLGGSHRFRQNLIDFLSCLSCR